MWPLLVTQMALQPTVINDMPWRIGTRQCQWCWCDIPVDASQTSISHQVFMPKERYDSSVFFHCEVSFWTRHIVMVMFDQVTWHSVIGDYKYGHCLLTSLPIYTVHLFAQRHMLWWQQKVTVAVAHKFWGKGTQHHTS